MKRSLAAIFFALAVAAGALACFQYYDAVAMRRAHADGAAAYAHYREAAEAEIARLKSAADAAQENIARLTAERDAALARAKTPPSGAPPVPLPDAKPPGGEKGGNEMMQGIAKMFSTEEGKKMMRGQMKMSLKMQYGDLAKALKLDPQTADQVLALLGDRQTALTEATFAAMKDGVMDDAAGKEIATKATALKKDYDEKLKAVLGDDGMTQLNGYERTLGDRMMLSMHDQQFTSAGSPLESGQRDALLQIMQNERMQTPASPFDAGNSGDPSKAMAAMRDDAAVEKWLAQEQDYQRRVLQAATQALNPDQVNTLQEAFKQQLEMQKFGVTMGKQMFSSPGASATVTVTPSAPPAAPAK